MRSPRDAGSAAANAVTQADPKAREAAAPTAANVTRKPTAMRRALRPGVAIRLRGRSTSGTHFTPTAIAQLRTRQRRPMSQGERKRAQDEGDHPDVVVPTPGEVEGEHRIPADEGGRERGHRGGERREADQH